MSPEERDILEDDSNISLTQFIWKIVQAIWKTLHR